MASEKDFKINYKYFASSIKSWEDRLNSEGGHFALNRNSLKEKTTTILTEIKELEEMIEEECSDIYPFSLCPTVNSLLIDQINKETHLKHHLIIQKEIKEFKSEIISSFEKNREIPDSKRLKLNQLVSSLASKRLRKPKHLKGVKEILGFSENISKQALSTIKKAETISLETVKQYSFDLDKNYSELRKTTKDLEKSPRDTQLQPIYEELSLLNQRRGELLQREYEIKENIAHKEYNLKKMQTSLAKLIEQQTVQKKIQVKLSKVKRIQSILDQYYSILKNKKINQLKLSFSETFNN
ncbi:hypothetical protein QUF70_03230 [Desulfobacterales bacterium HSG17]|nr:hypothetical protein [Desulfobacterales bacterium HSG17]